MNEKIYEYDIYEYETTLDEFIKQLKAGYGCEEDYYSQWIGCELDKIVPPTSEVRNSLVKVKYESFFSEYWKAEEHTWTVEGINLLQYISKDQYNWLTDKEVWIPIGNHVSITIKDDHFEASIIF
jgi:hypothetical protein